MRKKLFLFLCLALIFTQISWSQTPSEYFNHARDIHRKAMQHMQPYLWKNAIHNTDPEQRKERKKISRQLDKLKDEAEKITSFEGDSLLKMLIIHTTSTYHNIFDEKLVEIENAYPGAYGSPDKMAYYFSILNTAEDRLLAQVNVMEAGLKGFAQEHGLILKPNLFSNEKEVRDMLALHVHIRSIYLPYFRVAITESRLIEAANQHEGKKIELYLDSLQQATAQASTLISAIKPYDKSDSFGKHTLKLIESTGDNARNIFPELFEADKKSDRFEKLIDKYNSRLLPLRKEMSTSLSLLINRYAPDPE